MGQKLHKPVKPSLVIAIDFGTAYSGYAFAYRRSKHEIVLNDNWGEELGAEFYKAPTCVLYDVEGNFNSFGFHSEKNYFEMLNECKDEVPSYFKNFKMQLYKNENIGPHMVIAGESGCKKVALEVFAQALSFMKDKVLKKITDHNGSLPDEIQWVVTVPAIWNDKHKIFMREACLNAGITKELNSRKLIIALEPECASLYCRQLAWDQFASLDRENEPDLVKGTIYMVADLGGGTVDITVHRIIKDQMVEEVISPKGGRHGGYDVNREFEALLKKIFGIDFLDHLNKTIPEILPRMMLDFEKSKRIFDEKSPSVHFPIHYGLGECYQQYTGKSIRELLKGDNIHMSESGNIIIEGETMKKFFSKVVDEICIAVYDAVNACPEGSKPRYIYLVGGFAESKYVQEKIKSLESVCKTPKPQVMIPHEASLCVLKGAVIFGQKSKLIKRRFSPVTYSMLRQREFKKGTDDDARKFKANGKDMITYLKPILQIGEPMYEGLVIKEQITMDCEGKDYYICLYTSGTKIVDNPNATDVKELFFVVVKGTGQKTNTNNQATLQFIFGKTELQLRVKDSTKQDLFWYIEHKK